MWQNTKALLINAMISAFVGLIIGLILSIVLLVYQQEVPKQLLLRCSFYGLVIGSVSQTSVIVLYRYFLEKPIWGYGIVFLLTAIGTTIASYPLPPFTYTVGFIITVSETLAMLATFINLRYMKCLNKSLKRKQAVLKEK